jgi:hypothetical protein
MSKCALTLVAALAFAPAARAQTDELPDEGLSTAASVLLGGRYSFAFEPLPNDHQHEGAFDLRARFALGGPTFSYLLGLDGSIGGADTGFVYELEAHLVGAAVRWDVGMVGLSAAIGLGGVTSSVPVGAQIPIELFIDTGLGPVRILASIALRFVLGRESRVSGAPLLDFADEVSASLFVRIGEERRYWGNTVAGAGPAIGVVYRERMDGRMIGVVLALALSGGN